MKSKVWFIAESKEIYQVRVSHVEGTQNRITVISYRL